MSVLICVVKPESGQGVTKEIGSTEGMQLSMQTSELLKLRLDADLPGKHIAQMKEHLVNKDFEKFAELTMKEAN